MDIYIEASGFRVEKKQLQVGVKNDAHHHWYALMKK